MCICVCVCACVRERGRDRDRGERERGKERGERERERIRFVCFLALRDRDRRTNKAHLLVCIIMYFFEERERERERFFRKRKEKSSEREKQSTEAARKLLKSSTDHFLCHTCSKHCAQQDPQSCTGPRKPAHNRWSSFCKPSSTSPPPKNLRPHSPSTPLLSVAPQPNVKPREPRCVPFVISIPSATNH